MESLGYILMYFVQVSFIYFNKGVGGSQVVVLEFVVMKYDLAP